MIQFPDGFDINQVFIDLVTLSLPLFELLFLGFCAAVVLSALRLGRGAE